MNKNAPAIRFQGFHDDWEQRKVKDIFKITRGQVLAATETIEEKSDISPFPVYSSQTKNNGLMGYYKDYLFDTAITWTTDGANAGTVSYRSGRFYSTNVNGVLISDKGYTNKAISEILNLEAWKWVSHVGNPKLMNNVMGDISIMIPSSFEEQDRLSDFLNQLDNLITLHQRKLNLLKEQKKSLLQKMFPKKDEKIPEIRFNGFTDDWEQRKLENYFTERSDRSAEGELIAVTINSGIIPASNLNRKNSSSENKSNYKVVKVGDIAYNSMRMWQGASGYSLYEGILSPAYTVISPGEQKYSLFFSYMFKRKSMIQTFQKNSQGLTSDTWNLKFPALKKIRVMVPSVDESYKIAHLLKRLDNLITLHQRKLDALQEQKKGLLQKMFV